MKFLAFLVVCIFPAPNPNFRFAYASGYADLYHACEKKAVEWLKARLAKHDSDFSRQQASIDLVEARRKADNEGISPSDPRYPDLRDFYPFDVSDTSYQLNPGVLSQVVDEMHGKPGPFRPR